MPEPQPWDVAIISLACRFPGAATATRFWENLAAGVESIAIFSDDELLAAGIDPALLGHPDYVKAAPILDDHDGFDAALFGYSPREARLMDPQHRLFLEVAWEAFEDAGYDPLGPDKGIVGVYAGAGGLVSSYALYHNHPELRGQTGDLGHIGNDRDFLPSRVGFKLDLKGPAVNVQTACSTSLVAVHLACQALRQGEAEMALAGAAVVRVPHVSGYLAEPGSIYSRDGHCRPFDAEAGGTLFGSGVAAVLLKPLDAALAAGDRIHAVVKGSAVTNDGGAKFSYTAASAEGQARAMTAALRRASIAPETIGYVECHGTATALGDPVEIQALTRAFGKPAGRCPIGSVKSNFGHLEQCAGLAGLIKAVLALENGQIPPSINFTTPNPRIPFDASTFFVNAQLRPFEPAAGRPRRAAVNSVGMGGTNAFVILEEAPVRAPSTADRQLFALALSAASPGALAAQVANYRAALAAADAPPLGDWCFTANLGRHHFARRACFVARERDELLQRLEAWRGPAAARPGGPLVFLFSGQGAQRPHMGEALYGSEPIFRAALDRCFAVFEAAGIALPAVLFGDDETALARTLYAQPALFALQIGLVELWRRWGIAPDAVIGHSVGEFAAAVVAGVCAVEDAARLVAHRATLMDGLTELGGMLSIAAPFAELRPLWPPDLDLAADNAPDRTVASGSLRALEAFAERLEGAGIAATPLRTSHAFHSALMDPALPAFAEAAATIPFAAPSLRWISTLTGEEVRAAPDALYWRHQIRRPVRFREALKAVAQPDALYLEIGPGATLTTLARRSLDGGHSRLFTSLRDEEDDQRAMFETLAELYRCGREVEWRAIEEGGGRRIGLPLYPFQHERFWIEARGRPAMLQAAPPPASAHPLFGARIAGEPPGFETDLSVERYPFLADHRVFGRVVLPLAAILEATLFVAGNIGMARPTATDIVYQSALLLEPERPLRTRLSVAGAGFELAAAPTAAAEHWRPHAGGSIADEPEAAGLPPFPVQRARRATAVPTQAFYDAAAAHGVQYGPLFRGIRELRRDGEEAFAEVALDAGLDGTGWLAHPAFLDACLHIYLALADMAPDLAPVPTGLDAFHLWLPDLARGRVHALVLAREPEQGRLKLDVRVYAEDGRPAAWLRGLAIRGLSEAAFAAAADSGVQRLLYGVHWRETAAPAAARPEMPDYAILADRGDVGERLAGLLAEQRIGAALVAAGAFASGDVPAAAGIVYLGALDRASGQDGMTVAEGGLGVMQRLAALRDAGRPSPRLWLATRGAQGEAPSAPAQASLWGLGRSFALEYPDLWGGLIDLPDKADPAADAAILLRELAASDGEDQVAWRGGKRFALRVAPLTGVAALPAAALRSDASYWIVGGLGRLGRLTAEALIAAGARHLVLSGRRPPDASAEAALNLLRPRAEVHAVAADTASRSAARAVVDQIAQTMPPLKGVIHAAAVFEDALIPNLTPEALARVLRPKVAGAWALHRATLGLDLDFFVMFSSILGLWGAAGQAAYAAGNAFLDALAQHRRAHGLPVTVFDWGPWEDLAAAGRWGSVTEAMWKQRATIPLAAREAFDILLRLGAGGPAQIAVIDTRWDAFLKQFAAVPPLYRELTPSAALPRTAEPGSIDDAVAQHAASVLGLATIDPTQPLNELGLDSLLAVTLANRLRQSLGLAVPVARLLKGASIAELAGEPTAGRGAPARSRAPAPRSGSPWLIVHRPRPAARARLICFPFAGGGAATYRAWTEQLDPSLELVAIEPPGRQTRIEEPPIRDIGAFVDRLVPELLPLCDRPFAVYGHCLGTLTLFETVRRLIDEHGIAPAHIFVSGARPPDELHRQQRFEDDLTMRLLKMAEYTVFEPLHNQPDAVFAEAIREFRIVETEQLLASPDLRQLMLPTIRAEFEMGANYRYVRMQPWDVPITCLTGINDPYVTIDNARSWSRFTCNRFRLHTLDSEHFIVVDDNRAVIEIVNGELAAPACARNAGGGRNASRT